MPLPAPGWRHIRAFIQPTSMTPRSRSDEYSVRMRWIRSGIPGPISMRCITARLSTVFRSTMSLTAARYRSIRVASIASFYCRCRSSGRAQVRTGGREVESRPGAVASLLSPTLPTRMIWQDNCAQLILLVDRRQVESRAAALAERPAGPDRIRTAYRPRHSFRTSASIPDRISGRSRRAWRAGSGSAARHDGHLARSPSSGCFSPASATISATRSIGRRRTAKHCPPCSSGHGTALEAHAAEPLDLEKLSRISGIGIRSLQLGFKRHFGVSISEVLLDIRLEHLNARLLNARSGERIIDIAFDLGFTHLSRMASVYRAKFGETPSATLRRSR